MPGRTGSQGTGAVWRGTDPSAQSFDEHGSSAGKVEPNPQVFAGAFAGAFAEIAAAEAQAQAEEAATAAALAASADSNGSLLTSCVCGARKDAPRALASSFNICPAGHELGRLTPKGGARCSNCHFPTETVMYCYECKWGICSQCHTAMATAKPRKVETNATPTRSNGSAVSKASFGPAVSISIEVTLEDLKEHGRDFQQWFDDQLRSQALEKGVRADCIPMLEERLVVTDAKGRAYRSYDALFSAGIDEEALPVVFKYSTDSTSFVAEESGSTATLKQTATPSNAKRGVRGRGAKKPRQKTPA